MATRWYTDPTNVPDVSPDYDGGWDETASAIRRKLVIDTKGDNGYTFIDDQATVAATAYYLIYQFVSEPLDAISATLAVSKAAFICKESGAKLDGLLHLVFRKCDGDGSNPVTIDTLTDDVEFSTSGISRFAGPSDLTDQELSQGDRFIVEVGFKDSTKDSLLVGTIYIRDDDPDDLPENDTTGGSYNSWIETGDTFTVASGDPDPPWEVVKLGPMFAFA